MNRLDSGGETSHLGLNSGDGPTTTTTATEYEMGTTRLHGRQLKAVYYPGYSYYDDYYFPVWGWVVIGIVIFCIVALLMFLFHRQRQRRLQRLQQQQQQQMAAMPPQQQYPPSGYPSNTPPPDYGSAAAVATGYPVGEQQAGGSAAPTAQSPVWFSGGKPPEYAVTGQPVQRY